MCLGRLETELHRLLKKKKIATTSKKQKSKAILASRRGAAALLNAEELHIKTPLKQMRSGRVESGERVGGEILRKLEAIREKRRAVQASFIFCLSLSLSLS